MLDCLLPLVTDGMNDTLIMSVTVEDIKMAALQMGSLKASGLDGFQGVLSHTYWENLAADINAIIIELMEEHGCPSRLNATHIVLIPKVHSPEFVS